VRDACSFLLKLQLGYRRNLSGEILLFKRITVGLPSKLEAIAVGLFSYNSYNENYV